jgi:L-threonylcarbamoyladenylate synthase
MNQLEQAVKILKAGGIVVYPTDTAYGLAVDATNVVAVKKLYRLKGRGFHKPIHVIPPNTDIRSFARMIPQTNKIIEKLMPGGITIVLPLIAKGKSWKILSSGTRTIGVRLPNHKLALGLARALGKPITTTSANIAGEPNCYSVPEVKKQFAKAKIKPDFYLDGGKLKKTLPSTVVSLIKGVKILRQGPISETKIKNALLQSQGKPRS